MNYHKKEVQILKSEKDTLESYLSMEIQKKKKEISEKLQHIEFTFKEFLAQQKADCTRMQQQLSLLKGEKTAIQQQILGNFMKLMQTNRTVFH